MTGSGADRLFGADGVAADLAAIDQAGPNDGLGSLEPLASEHLGQRVLAVPIGGGHPQGDLVVPAADSSGTRVRLLGDRGSGRSLTTLIGCGFTVWLVSPPFACGRTRSRLRGDHL